MGLCVIVDMYMHTVMKSVDDEYDHYRDFGVAWILILHVCGLILACTHSSEYLL